MTPVPLRFSNSHTVMKESELSLTGSELAHEARYVSARYETTSFWANVGFLLNPRFHPCYYYVCPKRASEGIFLLCFDEGEPTQGKGSLEATSVRGEGGEADEEEWGDIVNKGKFFDDYE
ncbi:hypothetical protein PIB30_012705 [Stylosanthes scabra]|uniref:Uncharacterized protein n=1 Tax=Stylosanthes scabra TaxID=79078 RepID=A0ABU6Q658_9FABA|nr:hypothetical protein [Stylosanthes scabra]